MHWNYHASCHQSSQHRSCISRRERCAEDGTRAVRAASTTETAHRVECDLRHLVVSVVCEIVASFCTSPKERSFGEANERVVCELRAAGASSSGLLKYSLRREVVFVNSRIGGAVCTAAPERKTSAAGPTKFSRFDWLSTNLFKDQKFEKLIIITNNNTTHAPHTNKSLQLRSQTPFVSLPKSVQTIRPFRSSTCP